MAPVENAAIRVLEPPQQERKPDRDIHRVRNGNDQPSARSKYIVTIGQQLLGISEVLQGIEQENTIELWRSLQHLVSESMFQIARNHVCVPGVQGNSWTGINTDQVVPSPHQLGSKSSVPTPDFE